MNGQERALSWAGRYARVGGMVPGDVATLTFPIGERTDVVYIEKERFTLVRKGNDVVSISPPGRFCPLYQRETLSTGYAALAQSGPVRQRRRDRLVRGWQ